MLRSKLRLIRRSSRALPAHARATAKAALLSTSSGAVGDPLSVMVFGSSTDVGKTIISAGLCLAAMQAQRKVCYIKPLQTGELDEYFIQFYTNPKGINDIFVRTIQHWVPGQSAAAFPNAFQQEEDEMHREDDEESDEPMSDHDLVNSLQREIIAFEESESSAARERQGSTAAAAMTSTTARQKPLFSIVETTGGVLSSSPHGTSQADLYRSLALPVLLVGDVRDSGGVSSTLCAYESLTMRGYKTLAIVLIDKHATDSARHAAMIEKHVNQRAKREHDHNIEGREEPVHVFTLSPMPSSQQTLLHAWYQQNERSFREIFDHFTHTLSEDQARFTHLVDCAQQVMWPSQIATKLLDSAHTDFVKVFSAKRENGQGTETNKHASRRDEIKTSFDATGALHSQSTGYSNSQMTFSIAAACGRYGAGTRSHTHPMLHAPLVQLSQFLVKDGPGRDWAERVLFSECEEDAIDKALLIADRLRQTRIGESSSDKPKVLLSSNPDLSLSNALTIVPPQPYIAFAKGKLVMQTHELVKSTEIYGGARGITEDVLQHYRSLSFTSMAQVFDFNARQATTATSSSSSLSHTAIYENIVNAFLDHVEAKEQISALCIEAGFTTHGERGFSLVDPLYQRVLVCMCKQRGIPVVFDERTVGLYRLGAMSAFSLIDERPDVAVLGRSLSSGHFPLSAVLSSSETVNATLSGPASAAVWDAASLTVSPLACTAALTSLQLLQESLNFSHATERMRESFVEEDVKALSKLPGIASTVCLGNVFVVKLSAKQPATASAASSLPSLPAETAAAAVTSSPSLFVSLLRKDRVLAELASGPDSRTVYLLANPLSAQFDRQRLIRAVRRAVTKSHYVRPAAKPTAVSVEEKSP